LHPLVVKHARHTPEAPPSAAGRPLKRPESQTPFPTLGTNLAL
jgi:hypothetical protein